MEWVFWARTWTWEMDTGMDNKTGQQASRHVSIIIIIQYNTRQIHTSCMSIIVVQSCSCYFIQQQQHQYIYIFKYYNNQLNRVNVQGWSINRMIELELKLK